jgi:hypothetical protein
MLSDGCGHVCRLSNPLLRLGSGVEQATGLAEFVTDREDLEARVGIEPTHKGFADLSLTTWVPRLELDILIQGGMEKPVR